MRLTVPEPKIVLYKDGFEKHDKLGRQRLGAQLSELVERITDPMVIALDGAWGSGKSHFLKCWVGEHLKGGRTTEVVYFDAFEHDFLDDPLIALTGAIGERLEKSKSSVVQKAWGGIKRAAPSLVRTAGRTAVSIGTAGLVNRADDWLDAGIEALSDQAKDALDEFWQKEDGKRAAMNAFREALVKLTELDEEGKPTRKLIVVVDELDRCRPDYALSLLEIIKHFFNVDGVHFVLGCNMGALAESVRARYGTGYDGLRYLQKFVNVKFTFVPPQKSEEVVDYFSQIVVEMGLPPILVHDAKRVFKDFKVLEACTLREAERLALFPDGFDNLQWPRKFALFFATILEQKDKSLFDGFLKGSCDLLVLEKYFGLPKPKPLSGSMLAAYWMVLDILSAEKSDEKTTKEMERCFFTIGDPKQAILSELERCFLLG